MTTTLRHLSISCVALLVSLSWFSGYGAPEAHATTSRGKVMRLGYLSEQGSALLLIAKEQGLFRRAGVAVNLVPIQNADAGFEALRKGRLDAGTFAAGAALRRIAAGEPLCIVAGGGVAGKADRLAELAPDEADEREAERMVLVAAKSPPSREKESFTRVLEGLIRAYRYLQQEPKRAWSMVGRYLQGSASLSGATFDPNPSYDRLALLWENLALQDAAKPRDFLSGHVYEESYCDALDRLLDASPDDPVLRQLFSRAVCTPDCCKKDKNTSRQGGKRS